MASTVNRSDSQIIPPRTAVEKATGGACHQEPLVLLPGDVHVWSVSLECKEPELHDMQRLLSGDEQARADRLRFSRARMGFIAARGFLRLILARYLEKEPGEIRFAYGSHGKPELAAEGGLRFNLSHSGNIALYAMTLERGVGIDVEEMRSDLPCLRLAERYFSPREIAELKALPGNLQQEAFYNCWTRKEAYLKACGAGFSQSISAFDVSLIPGSTAALLGHRTCPEEVGRWRLADIPVAPGYRAALAVAGEDLAISCRPWR